MGFNYYVCDKVHFATTFNIFNGGSKLSCSVIIARVSNSCVWRTQEDSLTVLACRDKALVVFHFL